MPTDQAATEYAANAEITLPTWLTFERAEPYVRKSIEEAFRAGRQYERKLIAVEKAIRFPVSFES